MRKKIMVCLLACWSLVSAGVDRAAAQTERQATQRLIGTWTVRNETADQNYSGRQGHRPGDLLGRSRDH
jgi:hypothetical protein